ncbi:BPSS1780 family membrane protein [Pseudorhodoferax sp.]|uniref:BPSS1780 family membrane protein n=1 Tax=Pseudorhodoferax sp. TaxID=1993553 RepID=UPI002DD65B13|nr:BPSS1780 family membrane protein [Pseudorhodoferax sp.]
MNLNIVPARTGVQWVREGIQTFFRQPLALVGLFFMYMAVMLIVSQLPVLGVLLAGVLVPASTLGLMAATREATQGRFPMPTVLASAFRAGQQRMKAMLVLGLAYALLSTLASLLVSLLLPAPQAPAPAGSPAAQQLNGAVLLTLLLHLPLFLMFWHAPALVHWHGVTPAKSLFFSIVACLRNARAFLVYGLVWAGLVMALGMVIAIFASLVGSAEAASMVMMPFAFLMAAMMSTSIYFTFRDCFVESEAPALTTEAS